MRKVFNFMMVSLDGCHEGTNREIDWHNVDEEFNEFAVAQLDEIGTLVFGRVTYELMAGYWPSPEARRDDPVVAGQMNDAEKVVVSRTLGGAEWENSRLVTDLAEIAELRRGTGKAIAIFGSSALTAGLLREGLVDELRVMVNPVVLGAGRSVFGGERVGLELVSTRVFRSGNVLLTYRPSR